MSQNIQDGTGNASMHPDLSVHKKQKVNHDTKKKEEKKYDVLSRLLTFEPESVRKPGNSGIARPIPKKPLAPNVVILAVSRDACIQYFSPHVPIPLVSVCEKYIQKGQMMTYEALCKNEQRAISLRNACGEGSILVYCIYGGCHISPVITAVGSITKSVIVNDTRLHIEWEIRQSLGTTYTQPYIESMNTWIQHKKSVMKYIKPGLWHIPRFRGFCRNVSSGTLCLHNKPEKCFIATVWKVLSMNSFSVPAFSLNERCCSIGNR